MSINPSPFNNWSRTATARQLLAMVLSVLAILALPDFVSGQTSAKSNAKEKGKKVDSAPSSGPRDYRSANFLVHTDLPAEEANELLKRLETMLALISKYWGRPNKQTIEMFVVRDLEVWPPDSLEPPGRESIEQRAGLTITRFGESTDGPVAGRQVASVRDRRSRRSAARGGPRLLSSDIWPSGANVVRRRDGRDGTLLARGRVSRALPAPKCEVFAECPTQAASSDCQRSRPDRRLMAELCLALVLCHLLANNPNYFDRFRPLGLGILADQPDATFERVYGSMSQEIAFEYLFFLQNFDLGYEVTLTAWDWKTKFRSVTAALPVTCVVEAKRGWQASRLQVKAGDEIEISAEGTWSLSADGPEFTPFGAELPASKPDLEKPGKSSKAATPKRASKSATEALEELPSVMHYESRFKPGQLVGVLFNDYELSEPFAIPADGVFVAPGEGQLFLRCEEAWNRLADNKGKVNVKFKLKSDK